MEMSYGTVELQPPWAGELLARNRKVARNIWSTSDLSELEILQIEKVVGVSPWTSASESPNTSREDSSNQSRNHGGFGGGDHNLRSIDPAAAVVVGVGGSSSRAAGGIGGSSGSGTTKLTDKSSPMTSNNATKGSKNKLLKGQRHSSDSSDFDTSSEYYDCKSSLEATENEESILEYGPGIVRKLRSKYQSLAVRQSSTRPSLWRSASLENCLELDQQPQQQQQEHVRSPSPTPPVRQGKIYTKNMTQNIVESNEQPTTKTRGRSAATKAEKVARNNAANKTDRDRIRRARSVDALHNIVNEGADAPRTSRHRNQHEIDQDILEKCKTVVMPKEEIVIIEMSKPSHISTTGAALLRLTSSDKGKLQLFNGSNGYYYRNNSTTKNYFNANANGKVNSTSFDSSGLVRGDSISSPEHELPPHDIVRETARLFEIHNNNSAGGFNNNWRKVVGQALRLTNNNSNYVNGKSSEEISATESRETTPAPSPVIPTAVAVSTTSAPTPMSKVEKATEIAKGSSTNYAHVPINHSTPPTLLSKNTVSGKQIGVIRPTVNGFKHEDNALSKTSPGLSPIIMNPSLAKGKPPLSPKPVNLFCTSSPKTLLSATTTNANVNANNAPRDSANNNANEKTETKQPQPPRPGPRTILNANKNKSSDQLASTAMQNDNGNGTANRTSSGLHPSNQNGNDVIRVSSPDKHVVASLKNEESESKSHFGSVSLKPVPLVLSSSSAALSTGTGSLGASKGSQINASTTVVEGEAHKENRNTDNNASKQSSSPMLTDSTTNNDSSPSQRSSPSEEPLPFQQAKWKLRKQQNVNNKVREEILSSNKSQANTNAPISSNPLPLRSDKNANLETNNSQNLNKPKTTSEFKPKPKETESESKKVGVAQEVPPPLPSSPIPRVKLTESLQTQPPPQPTESKPRKTGRGNDNDGIMVFNFTKTRTKVPDYIEDDGLGRESTDDVDNTEPDRIDPKLIHFVGANVIINGKSSIQKKPKSKKLSISFNEAATTTFEYPSETSILKEEDGGSESNNNTSISHSTSGILGQKTPNGIHGSVGGLGSYTPSKGSPGLYQLGTYKEKLVDASDGKKSEVNATARGDNPADDYLRPDTETTTWSNEIGAADILF